MPWLLLGAAAGGAWLYNEATSLFSPSQSTINTAGASTPSTFQIATYAALGLGMYWLYRKAKHA